MAAFLMTSSLGAILTTLQQPALAQAQASFSVPAGPLARSLTIFGRQAGLQVTYLASIATGKTSPGVSGPVTNEQALAALLRGTGLVFAFTNERTVAISIPTAATGTVGADETTLLERLDVHAGAESAWGPVEGYAATRSATGTKTDTPIIETPQSVSVVTADQIATQKATSITEALSYTPGVAPAPGYSNSFDVFYSRGFRIHDGSGSVYRDGLRLGGLDGWATGKQEPYGLERVELLKGASSVLFGAASPGGVLNTVTKRPYWEKGGEVVVDGGNYDQKSIAGDINLPLSETVALRVVGVARNSDTWVDFTPNDTYYIAPSLTWAPTDGTSLTIMAHAQRNNSGYIHPLPIEGTLLDGPAGKLPRNRFVGEPDWDSEVTEQQSVSYFLSHEFSDALKLRHGARYINSRNDARFVLLRGWDATTPTAQDRWAVQNNLTAQGVSTDTSLEYRLETGPLSHTFVGGVDYSRFTTSDVWWLGFEMDDIDLYDPVYGGDVGPISFYKDRDGGRISRLGAYAQDQIEYGNLTVLLGGRHDWASDTPVHEETEDTRAFTGRAGAVYRFDNGFAPFVSFSQSFEPQLGFDDTTGDRFKPTRGTQIEAGLRWQSPDERFLLSAAVYQLTQTNVLSYNPVDDIDYQTGEVRARGFEFEAKGEIAPDWSVIASYAYTDGVITKDEEPARVGLAFDEVPRHQAALWVERRNLGIEGLTAGAGVRFVGETRNWGGDIVARVPAYALADAMVAYEKDAWRVALHAKNIFDEDALQCSYDSCGYGDGRRLTFSVSTKW